MKFEMRHQFFDYTTESFTELTAPKWLTSEETVAGSTMDCRWFWNNHILTLGVGKSVDTDFHTITRTE